jgi:eukaryotic-like serine/threonine-protein kinase
MTAVAPSPSPPPQGAIDALRRALGERYAVERELGRGGMGAVYLARDLRLDRPVALKVLPAEFATQVALRERFLLETRTAASFSHPNIVPVYAVEETADLLAYAMGLVEGETLAERVKRVGPLPVRELVRLLQDVGYALAYAHGRGVVHRDIKPDNVMIERATGRALVMDFGISRSITAPTHGTAALTRVGEVVGSPEYMSPEQASGDHVDGRSDIYSLGLTAHFAATGRVAVTGESTQKILVRQLTERIPSIRDSRPDLPATLTDAVDRCVAKDPAERYQRAEELVDAIDAAQLAEPEIPVPVRLFAGEAETLAVLGGGMLLLSVFLARVAMRDDPRSLDALIPLVLLVAVLVTRVLTALAEARRLAEAGFTPDEVMNGMRRVAAERATRRDELRANPAVLARRRRTVMWGVGLLVMGVVMQVAAFRTRVTLASGGWRTPAGGMALLFSGVSLMGTSFVLLFKSPLRMPPGERLFRRVWLGPLGRAFVRRGARAAGMASDGTRARPAASGASVAAPPVTFVATEPAPDRVASLEARVAELERWRQETK